MSAFELPARDDLAAWRSLIADLESRTSRVVGNHSFAADGVQQAILEFLQRKGRDKQGNPLGMGWLITISIKRALGLRGARDKASKSRDREVQRLMRTDFVRQVDPSRRLEAAELMYRVMETFETLEPEALRKLMRLVIIEGLSYRKAAAILPMPEGTAKWKVHQGRQQLLASLRDAGLLELLKEILP